MKTHLTGLAVAVWTSLPLSGAERGHAVLTVNDRTIVQGLTARASGLQGDISAHIIIQFIYDENGG